MDEKSHPGFHELAQETHLYPQESLLKVKKDKNALFIGLPKEISLQESRITLTPDGVGLLTANGHEIWIETGAGKESKYTDHEYSDAGAKIVYSAEEVYNAEIILKVEPPTLEELKYIKPGKTLISAIQLGNQTPEFLKGLNGKKITVEPFSLGKVYFRDICNFEGTAASNIVDILMKVMCIFGEMVKILQYKSVKI